MSVDCLEWYLFELHAKIEFSHVTLLLLFFTNIRVLHPAFEEDEILLILVGGILGLVAGGLQVVIFYS